MPFFAPPAPEFPEDKRTVAEGHLRYEDVAQDGRLMPIGLPSQMGGLWRGLIRNHEGARAAQQRGIVAILTRLTLTSTAQHIRLDRPVEARGGFELAHDRDPATDEVSRLFMLMWCDVYGATGRLFPPEPAGPLALAGQMFAEHTFTRPFGPPDQRKVTALPAPFDALPERRYALRPTASAGEAPEGARWLDADIAPDPVEFALSLDQTDSNQHVNSLVYIRLYIEAAQRTLAARGASFAVRSRSVDIAYRKPCFAGDRIRFFTRTFEHADGLGVAGYIATVGDEHKPRCHVRVMFTT